MIRKSFALLLTLIPFSASAQISITSADFHSAGDDILVSNESLLTPVDIVTTGASQTWDFSYFISASQDTISFLDVASTGGTYSLYFANISFNPNRSNIATASGNIPAIPGSPITITDPYSFYYKSTTEYKQQGIGATVSGFQTPVAFNNKDILYHFPMDYLDADSCDSDWSFAIPGFGYYGYTQKRVNVVDGWGTLITPYGTFDALRMVTQIDGTDTAYLDTLGFGFAFPRPQTKEYKWFGTGQKIPLLQITTTNTLGNETVSGIVYRDSLRVTAIDGKDDLLADINIYPSPASHKLNIALGAGIHSNIEMNIYNTEGKIMRADMISPADHAMLKEISIDNFKQGLYSVVLKSGTRQVIKRFVVIK